MADAADLIGHAGIPYGVCVFIGFTVSLGVAICEAGT